MSGAASVAFTKFERASLILQLRTLSAAAKSAEWDDLIEMLEGGYELFYDEVYSRLGLHRDVGEAMCKHVIDTLDVFRVINDYISEHPNDTEVASHRDARFRGFDGNNEGDCLAFARFLILRQKKWFEQHGREEELDGFNSHAPTYRRYSAMVAAWRSMERPFPLTAEQARAILAAAN